METNARKRYRDEWSKAETFTRDYERTVTTHDARKREITRERKAARVLKWTHNMARMIALVMLATSLVACDATQSRRERHAEISATHDARVAWYHWRHRPLDADARMAQEIESQGQP